MSLRTTTPNKDTTTYRKSSELVPSIGRALVQLAEAVQAAKRAGMTCAEFSAHIAVMWQAVPMEDADDAAV